jgi:hypothetical protein
MAYVIPSKVPVLPAETVAMVVADWCVVVPHRVSSTMKSTRQRVCVTGALIWKMMSQQICYSNCRRLLRGWRDPCARLAARCLFTAMQVCFFWGGGCCVWVLVCVWGDGGKGAG